MLYYINLSSQKHVLGGSSLNQIFNKIGSCAWNFERRGLFKKTFNVTSKIDIGGKNHIWT